MQRLHPALATSRFSLALAIIVMLLAAAPAQAVDDLADMSLEDLMNVTVTSASKREQNKVDAAAAIFVLTSEEIRRTGATNIPELLRHVPGLNVARLDAGRWSISSRGFSGQFSNKLLVLIDGRAVYTPFYGGVYWDVQDTMIADIDRIEVIRGPGGTLWGANAVNGVINITTKNAKDTQGVHASGLAGNQEYVGEARFGGMIGEGTGYRAFARGFKRDDQTFPSGTAFEAHDEIGQWRLGFRVDSDVTEEANLTVQGDYYDGAREATDAALVPVSDDDVRGGNVLARYTQQLPNGQSAEVQAYYDITRRQAESLYEKRQTADLMFQHDFTLGADDQWLFNWGTEYMWTGDDTVGVGTTNLDPASEDFHRFSGFMQAQWNLFGEKLQLIAGTKLEYNTFTDFEYQPTGRALWKFVEDNVVWAAVSRAVRSPTRVDRDLSFGAINGNKDFQSEYLVAYEVGYRNNMLDNVSFDLAVFFNDYDDLTALEPIVAGVEFQNTTAARTWGGEAEVVWQATRDLRFATTYGYLQIDEDISPTAITALGGAEGASPQHTWKLTGLYNVPVVPVEFDTTVWYVSELPSRADFATGTSPIPDYWRLDARVAWQALDWLGLEFVAQNLTESEHVEYGDGTTVLFPGTWVPRSYYGKVTLTF